ncbi:hypothetical protein Q7P37_002719 [Cladosporium fusiforme]
MMELAGALDSFANEESTPTIGREYLKVDIVKDLLEAENSDSLIRDLAITISQRGVVFFRAQDRLTNDQQKDLIDRLGRLTGKPPGNSLHVHPVLNSTSEFGVGDPQMSHISSESQRSMFAMQRKLGQTRRYDAAKWHSDIQFEPHPADYTSLRLTQLPTSGGDTLWASGCALYERFSEAYQEFFERLTATFEGEGFTSAAKAHPGKVKVFNGPRGSPANVGSTLTAIHPVVRSNPVTGRKSIFALGPFAQRVNELTKDESDELLNKFYGTIRENHDLQVRFRWRNPNDIAIWDNRSVFHTATLDYEGFGERNGVRAVGIGEKPFLDRESGTVSESAALG